jgi:hypothetical protein
VAVEWVIGMCDLKMVFEIFYNITKFFDSVCFLIFLLIINFVEFAVFVCALFYQVAVTMYVNMEIFVQFDNAFKYACLFFYSIGGNGEIIGNVNFVLLLIGGLIFIKMFYEFRLFA